jgi:hypothetical protein
MTTRTEFNAAVDQLERTVTELALVALTFRRLSRDLWPDPKPEDPAVSPPWTTK